MICPDTECGMFAEAIGFNGPCPRNWRNSMNWATSTNASDGKVSTAKQ
jgi:hypothetical protein